MSTFMKYAVTSEEMRRCDKNTSEFYGIGSDVLMERAALICIQVIDEYFSTSQLAARDTKRALVFCGSGNNGGDGVAIARLLYQKGYIVRMVFCGSPDKCTELMLKQLKIAEKYGLFPITVDTFLNQSKESEFDVIVDAMLGIGASRNLTGNYLSCVQFINEYHQAHPNQSFVLSVDIPTGISTDHGRVLGAAVSADATVTFNFAKVGQLEYPGCDYCGRLMIGDVGITKESFRGELPHTIYYDCFSQRQHCFYGELSRNTISKNGRSLLPSRIGSGNKGTFGKVLIIAGSENVSGACVLSAKSCMMSGTGMVRILTDQANAQTIRELLPEALLDVYDTGVALMDHTKMMELREKLQSAMRWADTVVAGPGLGLGAISSQMISDVIDEFNGDIVLDADALNILAMDENLAGKVALYSSEDRGIIMTPHMAEMARLAGCKVSEAVVSKREIAKGLADRYHCTIIAKDARSFVASSTYQKQYINMSGNNGMATAGSGDVLAGIVGAFACAYDDLYEAACAAAYVHGVAGDLAREDKGEYSMLAGDIVEHLGQAIKILT